MRKRNFNQTPAYVSKCLDYVLRGTKSQLVGKYEQLAAEATDHVKAEMFRQHAEHWRRKEI